MRCLFLVAMLVCFCGTASAQVETSQPYPGAKPGFMGMLMEHLNVYAEVGYDFPDGGSDTPWSTGLGGEWRINDRLILAGGSKYVVNGTVVVDGEDRTPFRSFVAVRVPLIGK